MSFALDPTRELNAVIFDDVGPLPSAHVTAPISAVVAEVLIIVEAVVVIVVVIDIDVDVIVANVVVVVAVARRRNITDGRPKRGAINRPVHIGRWIKRTRAVIHAAISPCGIVVIIVHRGADRDTGGETDQANRKRSLAADTVLFFLGFRR